MAFSTGSVDNKTYTNGDVLSGAMLNQHTHIVPDNSLSNMIVWEHIGVSDVNSGSATVSIPAGSNYNVIKFIAGTKQDISVPPIDLRINNDESSGRYGWQNVRGETLLTSISDDKIHIGSMESTAAEWGGRVEGIITKRFNNIAYNNYNVSWIGGDAALRGGRNVNFIRGFGAYSGDSVIGSVSIVNRLDEGAMLSVFGAKVDNW